MKITLSQLRKVVQEAIREINEAKDTELAIGDEVSVIVNNRPVKGKIVDKFSSRHADPMAVGRHMPKQSGRMIWSVDVGGKTMQIPADELEIIKSVRKGQKPAPQVRVPSVTTIESATMGRASALHADDSEDDIEKGKVPDSEAERDPDVLLDQDTLHEVDEDFEAEAFSERRYDMIARQLVFNWDDRTPEVNWKAVAKSYCNAKRSTDGKILDGDKLHAAIIRYLETDGDDRNQAILGGTHYKYR